MDFSWADLAGVTGNEVLQESEWGPARHSDLRIPSDPLPFQRPGMAGPERAHPGGCRSAAARLGTQASARAGDTPPSSGRKSAATSAKFTALGILPVLRPARPPRAPQRAAGGEARDPHAPPQRLPRAARGTPGIRPPASGATGSNRGCGRSRTARSGRFRELGGPTTDKMKAPSEKMVAFQGFFNFREAFSRVTGGLALMTRLITFSSCPSCSAGRLGSATCPQLRWPRPLRRLCSGAPGEEGRRLRSVTAAGGWRSERGERGRDSGGPSTWRLSPSPLQKAHSVTWS